MKLFFLVPFLLVANISFANTVDSVFRKNSPLPKALKVKILKELEARCPKSVEGSAVHIEEVSTEVREDQVDQGIRDYYFKTVFLAVYYFQEHPISHSITVESLDADINNPAFDRYSVKDVYSDLCN